MTTGFVGNIIDPWTKRVWTAQIHFYKDFYNKYLYCFYQHWGSRNVEGQLKHWSTLSMYTTDLNIHRLGYPRESWNKPHRYPGTTKFSGSQKLYVDFQLSGEGAMSLTFELFKCQLRVRWASGRKQGSVLHTHTQIGVRQWNLGSYYSIQILNPYVVLIYLKLI